jgi:hypothetical protein
MDAAPSAYEVLVLPVDSKTLCELASYAFTPVVLSLGTAPLVVDDSCNEVVTPPAFEIQLRNSL